MIPKIIHQIWEGKTEPLPKLPSRYIDNSVGTDSLYLDTINEDERSKRFLSDILGVNHQGENFPKFLLKSVHLIKKLAILDDFSISYSNGEWICHIEGLDFVLNCYEELFILVEIFIEGTYNVEINQPFTFIDIGMNVGVASLFFAKKIECKRVVAFEPFHPTLSFARKNLERNNIAQKIKVIETGLGYPARTVKINYSEEIKGRMGINCATSYIREKTNVREEKLHIMDVFEALNDITDEKLILKIDCEGSEYEILDRLSDTGLLTRFDIIMIEWHIKGSASLKKPLLDNNFKIVSMDKHDYNTGMIYAFKTEN